MHESLVGTNRTCRRDVTMSAVEGREDIEHTRLEVRIAAKTPFMNDTSTEGSAKRTIGQGMRYLPRAIEDGNAIRSGCNLCSDDTEWPGAR
jgi:hypothetical protein